MTERELQIKYFNWLCHFVYDPKSSTKYTKLLTCLNDIPYIYTNPLDANRESDGLNLRYRFGREQGIPEAAIGTYVDAKQCTMLEMLVALCLRCEESIMSDTAYGDRTSQWFWNMIVNLGLGKMTDEHFDISETQDIIIKFLKHEYGPNGEGGLVRVYDHGDLRNVEIWYQVMWYLTQF